MASLILCPSQTALYVFLLRPDPKENPDEGYSVLLFWMEGAIGNPDPLEKPSSFCGERSG